MPSLFEALSATLAEAWKPQRAPDIQRKYRCQCGRAVFFRNSVCLGCRPPLGFWLGTLRVHALQNGPLPGSWRLHDGADDTPTLRRCANFDTISCNWLLPDDECQPTRACAAHAGSTARSPT